MLATRCVSEFLGTFWLVLEGCGSAVLAAAFPYAVVPERDVNLYGLGFLGVSLAFGLTVVTMAYAIGHISGCHLNPAVSVGLWAGGRFAGRDVVPYVVAQVLGGIAPQALAGVAIGFTLTLIHLISIPVTNTSVNPARSTGVTVFAGADALHQLWFYAAVFEARAAAPDEERELRARAA
jgi:glycerol uptake facilitator-like aquaporin